MFERLQKYLSRAGIDSRRKCEEYILQGLVKVNHSVVTKLGTKIDPQKDIIEVKGKIVKNIDNKKFIYILLNKPQGYITSLSDPYNRPTVMDLLKSVKKRIYTVGRLDYNSEGLVFLTDDGDLTFALTHPSKEIEKTYIVTVKGVPSSEKLKLLSKGMKLENNERTLPCKIYLLKIINGNAILKIKLKEGKKRQIRRMVKCIGHPVLQLKRTQIGPLYLKGIKPGKFRYLTQKEIDSVKSFL